MTFALAFSGLASDAPRQRARCAKTGRFVAWAKVPQLRVPGAPRVVVIPAPVAEVVEVAEAAPVAPVAEAALVAGAGRWFRSKASALVAGARAAVAAGALAIGDGAPPADAAADAGPPPVTITGGEPCS